jgi:hypothetical protein
VAFSFLINRPLLGICQIGKVLKSANNTNPVSIGFAGSYTHKNIQIALNIDILTLNNKSNLVSGIVC